MAGKAKFTTDDLFFLFRSVPACAKCVKEWPGIHYALEAAESCNSCAHLLLAAFGEEAAREWEICASGLWLPSDIAAKIRKRFGAGEEKR